MTDHTHDPAAARRGRLQAGITASLLGGVLLLSACGSDEASPSDEATTPNTAASSATSTATSPPSSSSSSGTHTSESSPKTTSPTPAPPEGEEIAAQLVDATWRFHSGGGSMEPDEVTISDGTGKAETGPFAGARYELGEDPVIEDVTGDGVDDVALDITRFDGNSHETLWYVWVGSTDARPGQLSAEQMPYPIARGARCGNVVQSVTADDGSLTVQTAVRLEDDPAPCSEPGSGSSTRTLSVQEVGGELMPVQSAPVPAWGGLCPPADTPVGAAADEQIRPVPSADAEPVTSTQEVTGPMHIQVAEEGSGTSLGDGAFTVITFHTGQTQDGQDHACGFIPAPGSS